MLSGLQRALLTAIYPKTGHKQDDHREKLATKEESRGQDTTMEGNIGLDIDIPKAG